MRKKRDPELAKMIEITGTYTNHQETYDNMKQQLALLREVSSILKTPEKLETFTIEQRQEEKKEQKQALAAQMDQFKIQIEEGSKHAALLKHILTVTKSFGDHLLTYLEVPGMPKTNNDTEQFFREVKTDLRRTTGRQNNNKPILYHGEYLIYAMNEQNAEQLIDCFAQIDYKNFRAERTQWSTRTQPIRLRRQFKKDPKLFLKKLADQWQ